MDIRISGSSERSPAVRNNPCSMLSECYSRLSSVIARLWNGSDETTTHHEEVPLARSHDSAPGDYMTPPVVRILGERLTDPADYGSPLNRPGDQSNGLDQIIQIRRRVNRILKSTREETWDRRAFFEFEPNM